MELGSHGNLPIISKSDKELSAIKRRLKRINWPLLSLVSPVIGWMVFFFGVPQLFMLLISFMQQGYYGGISYHFTFTNYQQLFSPEYLSVIWTSIVFAFIVTLLTLVIGYPFAYAIATSSPKRQMFLLFLVIIPFWTSSLIRTFALMFITSTNGVINTILMQLHMITQPMQILYTPFAVYLGQFYTMLPYMILPLFASIQAHMNQPELLEAAYDMGATKWKAFTKVTLPLTSSGIAVGILLVFIPTLGTYFIPLLMGGGRMVLVGDYIATEFLTNDNWPYGAATSVGMIFITLILIIVLLRFMKNSFMEESDS